MGCSASKLVAAEPDPRGEQGKGDEKTPPPRRPVQARLSLAGGFNQFEKVKGEVASVTSGSGAAATDLGGAAAGPPQQLQMRYAHLSQRGYYPDHPNKANQDAVLVETGLAGDAGQHLFAVLDGHGEYGAECAMFAKMKVRGRRKMELTS